MGRKIFGYFQGYRVGWVKASSKAIQAIGTHVITHNNRVSVSHDPTRRKWSLRIEKAQLEDTGEYMCQLNTDPVTNSEDEPPYNTETEMSRCCPEWES